MRHVQTVSSRFVNLRHPVRYALLVMTLWLALLGWRAWTVAATSGSHQGCAACLGWAALADDLEILALAGLLLALAIGAANRWLRWIAGLVMAGLVVLFIGDILVNRFYLVRLFIADFFLVKLEPALIWSQFSGRVGGMAAAVLAMTGLILLLVMLMRGPRGRHSHMAIMVTVLALLAWSAYALTPRPDYPNSWEYRNVLRINLEQDYAAGYSAITTERLAGREPPAVHCQAGLAERRNVILLLLESWSPRHSRAFAEMQDWTPELDRLARRHKRFSRYQAAGFNTTHGLIASLGGLPLWSPLELFLNSLSYWGAWHLKPSVASVMNSAGYHTAFLTTGPLKFAAKGPWLRSLGFDEIEGNQHPFYRDWEKVQFQAASDQALFRRALQWQEAAAAPYFLVLETVTSHAPYRDPESGEPSLPATIRFMDRAVGDYVRGLEASHYFDDGILIIASDHRAMTPLTAMERQQLGPAARSRIPLIVIDHRQPGGRVDERLIEQADLLPSLAHWAGDQVCFRGDQTSLFADHAPEGKCAFHVQSGTRGVVEVLCADGGHGQIALAGDDSRFTEQQGLNASRRQALLDEIAVLRLAARAREQQREADQAAP